MATATTVTTSVTPTRAGRGVGQVLRVAAPVVVGLAGLFVWWLLTDVVGVEEYLLPGPAEVREEFAANFDAIKEAATTTGVNALFGLVAGSVLGVLLATVAGWVRAVDGMLAPVVASIAVVPIVALAPVLNTMYGADSEYGRRMIATLAAFVPVFVNTLRGLRQTTPIQRDLMRATAAGPLQSFRAVTLPTAAPYAITGVRIASSLAVISALVAEYFGGPRGGLGAFISTSAATSAYARAWAYVGAAILLGLAFYVVTAAIERLAQHQWPTTDAR
ncbi:NitT/TauT family transport system permease protein [Nocardioides thalensis]|uniref:NitT/TauT family transport system permease protein n=1 Tax=Nocardioides thalensis TaxID=1914755 RepID=A0A853C936_9ACTN|nr:ABC transporter permease subunit [Nocardioides thalensis]NYJ03699.1 NitT/TauT family transport system permease protein [Nocardioides thalensis]